MVICSLTVYISFDWIDRYNNNVYTLPQYRKRGIAGITNPLCLFMIYEILIVKNRKELQHRYSSVSYTHL